VVAGDGVAVRFRSAVAASGRGGTLHYILQRTVVLNKVEVRRGNGAERNAEISNDAHGFEKNFGKQDGRAPVEINAAGMHLLDEGAEEAEVVVRGGAERGTVGGAVHVGDVRADGEMDGDGDAVFIGGDEDAGIGMLYIEDAAREELAGGFAVADSNAVRNLGHFVDVLAGFCGHAELAFAEAGFDVFGSVAGESDFEIVDEGGAVHGDAGDEPSFHQVDQDGTEADFDDMAAEAPEDGFALFARAVDCTEEMAEIFGGENVREGIEKFRERRVRGGRLREVADADFTSARVEGVGVDRAERDGMDGVDAHGAGDTLTRAERNTK